MNRKTKTWIWIIAGVASFLLLMGILFVFIFSGATEISATEMLELVQTGMYNGKVYTAEELYVDAYTWTLHTEEGESFEAVMPSFYDSDIMSIIAESGIEVVLVDPRSP